MNRRICFVSAVVACLSVTLHFGVTLKVDTYEDVGRPDENFDTTICLGKFEVKTGTIIRTEDSMDREAKFVDAVISDNYASCAAKCCAYGSADCDTTVYIEDGKDSTAPTKENCYLFKCWFDGLQDMRCLFSEHEGYITSVAGGFEIPRITTEGESDEKIEATSQPKANDRKATTTPKSTNSPEPAKPKPTSKLDETKFEVPNKSTTKVPQRQDEQVCMATQYRCPKSRECILKRLVCDTIVDCIDESDEADCGDTAGGDKKLLTSKPSIHGDNPVNLPESHSGFPTDISENEILPSFIDQSAIYNVRDYMEPFQLPPSVKHQSSQQTSFRQSMENPRERVESSQSELEDLGTQQDIQHLRSLAEKQKNRNDLFSISSKIKESDQFPTLSEVSAVRDDALGRCQSGRCAPEEQFGGSIVGKQTNWHTRLGQNLGDSDEDVVDLTSSEVKPDIQQRPLDMDGIGDKHPVMPLSNQGGLHLGQDSSLHVTEPPKSRTRFSKPQHVDRPVKYGSVLSQYRDDDFPEQRYTDDDLFQERPVVHNSVRARTQEDQDPQLRNHFLNQPVVPKDGDDTKADVDNVREQSQEHSSHSDIRRPNVMKHTPVQIVTTEQPMQWLDHKDRLIHHVSQPDVQTRVLKPQVDVVQSDYFPDWPVDISFLYGDSYNIGEDWTQLQNNNWHDVPPPKNVQRHNDGMDDGWYDDRYDGGDDQYGFYQPKQRNRGEDRVPSRSRNRYRGNGQQKTHGSGKHRDRNRNYGNVGYGARQYPSNHKQEVESEYPETGNNPYHEDVAVINPRPATTMPTPEDGDNMDEHTTNQKTTLPPNPPPPTHIDKIISQPPDAGKDHDLQVDMEAMDTVEVAKGALFPLVVGLLLTLFLLMMVGCRLRFMNRRLRYGRMKNNAHDADYLINGMYL